MNLEDFEDALDRFGGDLGRWPEDLRRGAEALLAQDAQAESSLRQAQALDAALAPDPVPTADPGLTDRIMQRISEHEAGSQEAAAEALNWRWLRPASWPIPREFAAVGAGAVLGMIVGAVMMNSWVTSRGMLDLVDLASASYFAG